MGQPEITISQGTLRGSIGTDYKGSKFFKFQGIPYAKPPLGNLRFRAPQPPENWSGVFDATKEGDECYALDPLRNGVFGSENCLVLNIFTNAIPDLTRQPLRPVLVWIHGGGFIFGSSKEELYGPEFLVTQDVVLVTLNYRLGLLGFLSLDDPSLDIPGNAGLKDQVMALRWVQKNISSFGGDPQNVTIFGESAGGASVHLQVLSPLAKGLFHKAIAQSGCALNPWARGGRPGVLAEALGLQEGDDRGVYEALAAKSVEEVYEIQGKVLDPIVPAFRRLFGFVIEKNSKEPFLDAEPLSLIKSGRFNQVPFMLGFTSAEGMLAELFKKPGDPDLPDFATFIPWSFGYQNSDQVVEQVAKKLKQFYFGNEEFSEKLRSKLYDITTDAMFLYDISVIVRSHAEVSKAPIYFYRVTVESELNMLKKFLKVTVPGVSHGDELGYLFTTFITSPEIKPGSKEEKYVERFLKLWTNFARSGNPTPDKNDPLLNAIWQPYTNEGLEYLDIGDELRNLKNPEAERLEFWNNLFEQSPAAHKQL